MSFGKMNDVCEIFNLVSNKDCEGFVTKTEEVVATVHCYREGRHGTKRWVNLAAFSDATDLFRIRVIPGVAVTTSNFIVCSGERFDIISVEDVKGRKMYLEILAKKVVHSRG